DPWWNVSAQNQATDRAHRIGQTQTVQVYKLIARDTVEEKILRMQERKQALADAVVHEGEGMLSRLTAEELLSILEL
ncbi:MAG: DEAD/DEAH box helicase, partial [Clostridia bacterium]|nr:DEAD/DEAH box helicase [Clostridia bacterium]